MGRADDWRKAELSIREDEDAEQNTQTTHYATDYAVVYRDDEGAVQSAVTDSTLGAEVLALGKRLTADGPSKADLVARAKALGLPHSGTVLELQDSIAAAEKVVFDDEPLADA